MSNAFLNALPPLFLFIIFGCTYWVYLYNFCLLAVKPLYYRVILILIHNIISIMFLWSFFATIWSSVGKVPQEYKFSRSQHSSLLKARTEDDKDNMLEQFCEARHLLVYTCTPTGSIRYCSTCMLIKPDRAHHCITCEVCYLRMDHHCPWVNNCIGFKNYKNFLLLIFYTFLICFFFVVSTVQYMISAIDNADLWDTVPIGLVFGLSVVLGLVTFGFFWYHLYLVGRNETTLENVHNPHFVEEELTFDLGIHQNFVEVFGNRWYLWLLPVFSSMGCGYMYLVARK